MSDICDYCGCPIFVAYANGIKVPDCCDEGYWRYIKGWPRWKVWLQSARREGLYGFGWYCRLVTWWGSFKDEESDIPF